MASGLGDRAGLGLFTALALALGVGCGAEAALTITVIAGDEVARPNALNVAWLSDRGTIYQRDGVPVATEGPLASIFVRLDRSDTSDRRVLVRGMGPGGAASIGAIRVPYASAANQAVSITLRAALADGDGDGTPDVIDDCAGNACAPRVDAGVPTDGPAPPSAPDVSDGQAAADAQAPADSDPGMEEETRVHPRPPSAGLVALWEMDDGAGTMVRDSSGHGNAGTIMRPSASNWAPGQQGTALALGGTSWMSAPAFSRYDAVKGLTLSAWVFWAQSTNVGQVVMARQRGTGSQNAFWLGMASNRLHFSVEDLGISGTLPSGRWVHVAGTYDGSRVILYVGGVEIGRGTIAPTVTSGARGVSVGADVSGADPTAGSSMFVGRLDDVAIHDRALTVEEIAAVAK